MWISAARARRKLIGYSDITAYHAIARRSGIVPFTSMSGRPVAVQSWHFDRVLPT